jgi:aspartate/methionine/tyrosine aminotransferase
MFCQLLRQYLFLYVTVKIMRLAMKVAVVPVSILGENGEGFVRISLTTSSQILELALEKIEKGGQNGTIQQKRIP